MLALGHGEKQRSYEGFEEMIGYLGSTHASVRSSSISLVLRAAYHVIVGSSPGAQRRLFVLQRFAAPEQ